MIGLRRHSDEEWAKENLRPAEGAGSIFTPFCDVAPRSVEWLWRSRIPLGMLTILDGDPGLGKSFVTLDLAARLSRGDTMPDDAPGPAAAGVVIVSAEDPADSVIRPRLDAAGADLKRVGFVQIRDGSDTRDPLITETDLAEIERHVLLTGAKLVIIDPLMAHLPAEVNAHRDQDVRRALKQLSALAERTGVAILVVRHLNKGSGAPALYRGGGSIGIIGAARSALMLAEDPDDTSARVLAPVKSNLSAPPPALRLRVVADSGALFPRVHWEGESTHGAEDLLAAAANPGDRLKRIEAEEFLRRFLSSEPAPTTEVEEAAREEGIAKRTLDRARKRLGVVSKKRGQPGEQGHWCLVLPKTATHDPKAATLGNLASFEETDGGIGCHADPSSKDATDPANGILRSRREPDERVSTAKEVRNA